jgi:hypothetical protein
MNTSNQSPDHSPVSTRCRRYLERGHARHLIGHRIETVPTTRRGTPRNH